MSDWNKYGRDDEQRRSGANERDRRDIGRDDSYGQYGDWRDRDRERRSFGEGEERGGYGSQAYRAAAPEASRFTTERYGQGSSRNEGGRDYGAQTPGRGYGQSDFGRPGYGERGARPGQGLYGQHAYGRQDYGRADLGRADYARQDQGHGVFGGDQRLEHITDGDEHAFGPFSSFGGQGEHRGRGPKNYIRSDERIREDVNDRLSDDSWLDASEIEIQVKEGEVTLSGTVPERHDKRRAEDIVERISGVKHVQNNLRVQPSTSAQNASHQTGEAQTGGTRQTGAAGRGPNSSLS